MTPTPPLTAADLTEFRGLFEDEILPPLRLPLYIHDGSLWMNDGDEPDLADLAAAVNAIPRLLATLDRDRAARDALSEERLTDILLEHIIGPGGRCACGEFIANGDHRRLARHLAAALAASPSRALTETSATAYGSVNPEPRIDRHDVEHAGEQR